MAATADGSSPTRKTKPRVDKAAAGAEARAAAALIVHAVRDRGRSLTDALDQLPALNDERDRPLVHELCYGLLRTLPRHQAVAELLLHKPLERENGDLQSLILVGLYQLTDTRIPPHAAVAATVEATRILGKQWATSLVNALLRRFVRERAVLTARAEQAPEVRWLHPDWLLHRLEAAWPHDWQQIVAAGNGRAPMTLRLNPMRTTRSQYLGRLMAAGLTARPVPGPIGELTHGLVLDRPLPVASLPGFADGLASVQDAGAQLAAVLLDAEPKQRVLDACAAPGGKSAHILERAAGDLDLTALDVDPKRLQSLRENLDRLGLSARVVQGDAAAPERDQAKNPAGDWARQGYHRILLDVPCSATGVIRRHPDIKWLRRDSDIAVLCDQQARMLDALWPLLLPGGTLLYATCSLLPEENEEQIQAFLGRRNDARPLTLGGSGSWGLARSVGHQILPCEGGPDGFYYAGLVKCGSC